MKITYHTIYKQNKYDEYDDGLRRMAYEKCLCYELLGETNMGE
jgi:hypothetical protein